eukprot:scaffold314796_cov38-Prasinocladus_malaysianus.AAC.1
MSCSRSLRKTSAIRSRCSLNVQCTVIIDADAICTTKQCRVANDAVAAPKGSPVSILRSHGEQLLGARAVKGSVPYVDDDS